MFFPPPMMGMPMGMGMPMPYGDNSGNPRSKKKVPPPDPKKWREWSGLDLARWLNSLKLPEGMKYAYPIIRDNLNADMLPKLTTQDLESLSIKLPHAKLIIEHVKRLKDGSAGSDDVKNDSGDESEEDAADAAKIQPFSVPVNRGNEKFDFFLSHRGPDTKKTLVKPLSQLLNALGVSCFFDREIEVGMLNEAAVAQGLFNSRFGLVFLSPNFFDSKWCLKELLTLHQRMKYDAAFAGIIPVFYDVKTDLSNISAKQQQKIQAYKAEVKAVTHIAGMELPTDDGALRDAVSERLVPVLFKKLERPCPPVAEIKKAAAKYFA